MDCEGTRLRPESRLVKVAGGSIITVSHLPLNDLGLEGGVAGGQLLAEGAPEEVTQVKESYTGQCLKEMV